MKKQWQDYLKGIGFEGPYIEQASKVLKFYDKVLPDKIDDIFVGDLFNKAGERQYESMWVLTCNSFQEAREFLTQDKEDFDWVPSSGINYWRLKKQEYDFRKATEQSRMSIEVYFENGLSGSMKASKENCDHLRDIFMKYIVQSTKGTKT